MTGQLSIFDFLYPQSINPIVEVAKRAQPYWTTSKAEIVAFLNTEPDIKPFAAMVKHEYSPYGYAGYYGGNDTPNSMLSWTLKANHIETEYYDHTGQKKQRNYSWEDFAMEIADLIWSNEY